MQRTSIEYWDWQCFAVRVVAASRARPQAAVPVPVRRAGGRVRAQVPGPLAALVCAREIVSRAALDRHRNGPRDQRTARVPTLERPLSHRYASPRVLSSYVMSCHIVCDCSSSRLFRDRLSSALQYEYCYCVDRTGVAARVHVRAFALNH